MAFLLFVGETVPSFGSILDLVGGSTITCLTFIMPPLLYIFVMDYSLSVEERQEQKMDHMTFSHLDILGL